MTPEQQLELAVYAKVYEAIRAEKVGDGYSSLAQFADPVPVPEPTTIVVWGLGLVAFFAAPRWKAWRRLISDVHATL